MDERSGSQPPLTERPRHPGAVLRQILEHHGIAQAELAAYIGVSASELSMIIHGRRAITPRLAWLLSMALATTPEFWMELQIAWALHRAKPVARIPAMPRVAGSATDRPSPSRRGLYFGPRPPDDHRRGQDLERLRARFSDGSAG